MGKVGKAIITTMVCLFIFLCFSLGTCHYQLKKAGGIEQVIIEAGKEIKRIKKEIDE